MKKENTSLGLIVLFFLQFSIFLFSCNDATAQKKEKKQKVFIDTLDNAFDASYYLYNLHGFMPIPSLITEPAVGYGGVLAGAFFIPKKKNKNDKRFKMPDVAVIGGAYTQNNTWLVGAGYFGFWKDDHIRYRGVIGYGDVNLKYYGNGDGFLSEHPVDFKIKAIGFVQQAIFRIKESRFLLGGKYIFTKTKVSLFNDSDLPFFDSLDFNLTNSGIGIIAEYENFDNMFSPNKGLRANITYNQYLEFLGSDRYFGLVKAFALYYLPVISTKWVSGFRAEGQIAVGDPPFYAYPFVYLRGVPVMRYQGKYVVLAETEQSVALTRRWSMVAFGGYGQTFFDNKKGSIAWNTGAGIRYLIARIFGLKMGIDVARGPEDWAFYIVFGNSWMK